MVEIGFTHYKAIFIILILLGLVSILLRMWYLERKHKSGRYRARKYHYIYDYAATLYCETLLDGIITEISPSVSRMLGYKEEELVGKNIARIHNEPEIVEQILSQLKTQPCIENIEFTVIGKDGTIYILLANVILLPAKEEGNRVISIGRDITEYIQAKKRQEELEAKQKKLTELEAFTHTVSHDMKAPLRAIEGYGRIILEDYPKLDMDAKQMLESIVKISSGTLQLIDRVLEYSTTSEATILKKEINSKEVFLSVFEELQAAYPGRQIEFILEDTMPLVLADPILIRQVIYNLLDNAIKFTRNRECASIKAGCYSGEQEWIFFVSDNGAGFDMKYANKLFCMFQRMHDKEDFEGSGIGLAIVYKIIQKHKGRIWIESELDQGTRVCFTLPME